MEALQAVVLSSAQLRDMLTEAAKQGAVLAVRELRADLHQSPEDTTLQRLRGYLADPASVSNPNDHWADSGIIRRIQTTARGKPKSTAWFMKFQRQTGLNECLSRQSPAFGRRREWTFVDISRAWGAYYRQR
ncbi:hypothetical protein FJ420_31915 [Mesorhizobium sp. B3-1-3]|uniref:hypothetical protein n=1 Tax=unclassified Mesorhizobium TaxID=325217 RepID=UPI001126EAD0|nr:MULTISPECIES: hypothetical protein [unclassified Mesorhizobium]TPI53312.1 hypothetical protein FJ424_32270 [Mesorhizobium sp. B3-1-8]TPI60083.1 hypothetical protein FJ420_31915 [Mesorhizobium sp. B3-1-3]